MAPALLPRRTATSSTCRRDTVRGDYSSPRARRLRVGVTPGRPAALCLLASLLVVLAIPMVQGHTSGDPHPHVVITLTYPYENDGGTYEADDRADATAGRDGRLELRWIGHLRVNTTSEGARYVQVPVPWTEEALERFEPAAGWPGTGTHAVIMNETGEPHLRWTWASGAPEPGTVLQDVEVQMAQVLHFAPDAAFRWHTLGNGAAVTVDVPETVDVVHQGTLIRTFHDSAEEGRQSYFQTRLDGPLEITFRPTGDGGVDAGRAAPPWPGWAWVIIAGLAAASAGVWWIGYLVDTRRAEREARDAQDRTTARR